MTEQALSVLCRTRRRHGEASETRVLGMTAKKSDEALNMSQRTVLQYLSLADWKLVNRLPIPAGELILSRLAHLGWIEIRREKEKYGSATHDGRNQGDALAHSKHSSAVGLACGQHGVLPQQARYLA